MGGEEVKLKLIFANDPNSAEITVNLNSKVRDVKSTIMQQQWPASFVDVDTVERIRLFAAGRELGGKGGEDNKSLKDARLPPSQNYPTPVHVVPVQRSAENNPCERDASKPSSLCSCVVL
mmetsp:Transcript_109747/g.317338  ORF Transcript_109747/g.317338 Transcript_109747/m.317338 type:complete len:120 (-) Transcript_109747:66-425(-)